MLAAQPSDSPESFAPALRRFFAKRAHPADVQDLVQEVLMRMHARQSGDEIAHMKGYVFAVAANVLKESRRKADPFAHLDDNAHDIPDEVTPERIVAGRGAMASLMEAIDGLPPRTREIFVAHRFEDMSYAAIASLFGVSISAVEKHIMAALKILSTAMREAN